MTEPESLQFVGVNEVRLRQRTLLYFSGCDYFRLARNPRVAQAARLALETDGLNVAASRRTTGNRKDLRPAGSGTRQILWLRSRADFARRIPGADCRWPGIDR